MSEPKVIKDIVKDMPDIDPRSGEVNLYNIALKHNAKNKNNKARILGR